MPFRPSIIEASYSSSQTDIFQVFYCTFTWYKLDKDVNLYIDKANVITMSLKGRDDCIVNAEKKAIKAVTLHKKDP